MSFQSRIGRHVSEASLEAYQLLAGRYPSFVTARRAEPLGDEIPVFVFHSIEPTEFEAQLLFLSSNGYQTIDCDTFLRAINGEIALPEKAVMLTIDDGRASVWTYGFPLLKKYGMTAVIFLIPGLISEGGELGPTLDDRPAAELVDRDPGLMNWAEIRAMADSGCADFQSHTLYHHKVPVSPEIVGVVTEKQAGAVYDVPHVPCAADNIGAGYAQTLVGTPEFTSESLMSAPIMFRPDPDFIEMCRKEAVTDPAIMRDLAKTFKKRHGSIGRFEDAAQTTREIERSLRLSREQIAGHLDKGPVRHLCYPYTIGTDASVRISRETGYVTNFWGTLPGRRNNRPGNDPMHCARLKGDFIFRLPGEGREELAKVFLKKLTRRMSGAPVY